MEREFYAELFVLRSIVQFTKNHVNCLVSWTNWVNSCKFMDNCWISCQVMENWAMLLMLTSLISCLHPRIRPKSSNLFMIFFVKLSLNTTFETFWPHYARVSGRGLPVRKKRKSLQVNKTAIPSIRIPKLTNLPTMTSWCWFDQPMARFC